MKRTMYPIYYVEIFWPRTVNGERTIDSGGASYMFKAQPTEAELQRWADGVWAQYFGKGGDPGKPVIEWRFVRWDTWCLTWFSHYTWDVGQTDEEALDSFREYVLRTEVHNERVKWETGKEDDRVLMGAEDHWRWSGKEPGDRCPPCRCDGCKKNGVVRICH